MIVAGTVETNNKLSHHENAGWKTYNFEVAIFHTYVADGLRVHNNSGWLGRVGNAINNEIDNFFNWDENTFGDQITDFLTKPFHLLGNLLNSTAALFEFESRPPIEVVNDQVGGGRAITHTSGGRSTGKDDIGVELGDTKGGGDGSSDRAGRQTDNRGSENSGSSVDDSNVGRWGQDRDGDGVANWRDYDDGVGYADRAPILLDLSGNGIEITDLSKSTVFIDAGGDGLEHRTAWAAAGNGVLYFDADGSNTISDSREYIFTEWDPSASDDMDALRSKFDTNGDGKLSGSELDGFKVMETMADGSLVSRTMSELGITEINLNADATYIELPDGSMITGQTSFVMEGQTRTVATVTLTAEVAGHRVEQELSDQGGNRVVEQAGFDVAGGVAFNVRSETNADGTRITNLWDDTGDGVFDRVQTIDTNASSKAGYDTEELVSNYIGSNAGNRILADRSTTFRNDDGSRILIERDETGGGWISELETHNVLNAAGDLSITVSQLTEDESLKSKTNSILTNNGLTRNDYVYVDGDGAWETRTTTNISIQGNNRVFDTIVRDAGYDVLSRQYEQASLDGKTRTFSRDLDGTGGWDIIERHTIAVDAEGNTTTTVQIDNGNHTDRSETIFEISEDGLNKNTTVRLDGDGDGSLNVISETSDEVSIAADGTRTTNIHLTYADGTTGLRSRTILDGDQIGLSVFRDLDLGGGTGFAAMDLVRSVGLETNGDRVDELWDRNGDGSIRSYSVETTSEDGLEQDLQRDLDGDGDFDRQTSDITTIAQGGSSNRVVETRNVSGGLIERTVVTRSSDGLVTTTTVNEDGVGSFEGRTIVTRSKVANAIRVETVNLAGDLETVLSRNVTIESADRLERTSTVDFDADGVVDSVVETFEAADGSKTSTTSVLVWAPGEEDNAAVTSRTTVETSADGLDVVTTSYLNADEDGEAGNTWEVRSSTSTEFEANGDVTTTTLTQNADQSRRSFTETTVSDDGRTTTISTDIDGDGVANSQNFDRVETRETILEADGDTVVSTETQSGDGSRLGRVQSIVSGDGLDESVLEDRDGEGGYDFVTVRRTDIAANGDRTLTETFSEVGGPDRRETITTTSGDGRSSSVETDVFADGTVDERQTSELGLDGLLTVTTEMLDGQGNAQSSQTIKTSANGLEETTSTDADGDGNFDSIVTQTTMLENNGSRTVQTKEYGNDGALIRSSNLNTSYDGRHSTEHQNLDGDVTNEREIVHYSDLGPDGVVREWQRVYAEDGSTIFHDTRELSADGRVETTSSDSNDTETKDRVTTQTIEATGEVTSETVYRSNAGGLLAQMTTVTAADGHSSITMTDIDGNGRVDRTTSQYSEFNLDGSVVETQAVNNDRGIVIGTSKTTTSDDGLRVRTELDVDGSTNWMSLELLNTNDGVRTSVSETKLEDDGSRINRSFTSDSAGNTLYEQTNVVSGNGLQSATSTDFDGDGNLDRVVEIAQTAIGATIESVTEFSPGGRLQSSLTRDVSADGRNESTLTDWDGDGLVDYGSTVFVDDDRNVTQTYRDYEFDGMIGSQVTGRMSANGFQADYHFDFDADGDYDISREEARSFDGAGNTIRVLTERYGQVVITYQETEIVSADGLSSITNYDMDGDGVDDGTTTSLTEYLSDGGMQESTQIDYADGSLRYSTITQTSADGRRSETSIDFDGNGVSDQKITHETTADGATTQYINTYTEGGYNLGTSISETSADGLRTVTIRNDQTEIIERSAIDLASYTWTNGVPNNHSDETLAVSHYVDALGVDTWTLRIDGIVSRSVRLDEEAKIKIFADAARLYDTLLDRDMTTAEREKLVLHIEDGRLDELALATTILREDEVADRYGDRIELNDNVGPGSIGFERGEVGNSAPPEKQVAKAAFIAQLYLNALGRPPSLDELARHLEGLADTAGSTGFAETIVDLSNSAEHRLVGNIHLATNNFDTLLNPVQFERQLDRSTVEDTVRRLIDVVYERDATAEEVAYYSKHLLDGDERPSDLVEKMLSIDGSIQGQESNGLNGLSGNELVTQAFRNGLSRHPTEGELEVWTSLLSGGLTTEDFVASIALSADHRAIGFDHLSNMVANSTGPGVDAVVTGELRVGNAADNNLFGGEGDDTFRGKSGEDILYGNAGADTYEWSKGDGNDIITDRVIGGQQQGVDPSEVDTLKLLDVESSDVRLERDSSKLQVVVVSTGERIDVVNQFSGVNLLDGRGIEVIQFADGIRWNLDDILEKSAWFGSEATDRINGGDANDRIEGLAGEDVLQGREGHDILIGGTSSDTLSGGNGSDTYVWKLGDGNDRISDYGTSEFETDILSLSDVTSYSDNRQNISLLQDGDDLLVVIDVAGSAAASIQVDDFFQVGRKGIDRIQFADDEVWNRQEILDRAVLTEADDASGRRLSGTGLEDNIIAYGGSDTLIGNQGDDLLVGGNGHDLLYGGDGNDLFEWNLGDGNDRVFDHGSSPGEIDTLRLKGVLQSEVEISRSGTDANPGDDLELSIDGATITIEERFIDTARGVENLVFDDGVVVELLSDPSAFTIVTGTGSNNTLNGTSFRDSLVGNGGSDELIGGFGDDELYGGLGNDTLNGGLGNDSYHWTFGEGTDVVVGSSFNHGLTDFDTLLLHGVTADIVEFRRASGSLDLRVIVEGNTDAVVLKDMYAPTVSIAGTLGDFPSNEQRTVIDRIEFDDGSYLTLGEILDEVRTFGTVGNNVLQGSDFADYIVAGNGNDHVYGNGGNDVLIGQRDNDTLDGGEGSDTYVWQVGNGNDVVTETANSPNESDTLKLLDVLPDEVFLQRVGGEDLRVRITSSSEFITIRDQFGAGPTVSNGIEFIEFSDGTVWGLKEIWDHVGFYGSDGADTLSGTAFDDKIYGKDGNDTINGFDGDDTYFGGNGDDLFVDSSGSDHYEWYVNQGQDVIDDAANNPDQVDTLFIGGVHLDDVTFVRQNRTDLVISNDHTDGTLTVFDQFQNDNPNLANAGIERLELSDGTTLSRYDILSLTNTYGGAGADTMNGQDGTDRLFGQNGNDVLRGNSGDDWLYGGNGADQLFGGDGTDIASYKHASTGVDVDLTLTVQTGATGQQQTGDRFGDIEGIEGSLYNDILQGDGASNAINGLWGVDVIYGRNGSDNLNGGLENDTLYGGAGSDTLEGGAGADALYGGIGHDTFIVDNSSDLTYDNGTQGETDTVLASVSYALGSSGSVFNIERLMTTDEQSTASINLTGNNYTQTIIGNRGNNLLDTGSGAVADTLIGGEGDDTYRIRNADDQIIEVSGHGTNDRVLSFIDYSLGANVSVEILEIDNSTSTNALALTGNDFSQTVSGNFGVNNLSGLGGNDTLFGREGGDTLSGGAGADVFVYATLADSTADATGRDFISDFEVGVDKIDLSAIDANSSLAEHQSFEFVGTSQHTTTGSVRYFFGEHNTIVTISVDDDLQSEMSIMIAGHQTLTEDDFLGTQNSLPVVTDETPEETTNSPFSPDQYGAILLGTSTDRETLRAQTDVGTWIAGNEGQDDISGSNLDDYIIAGAGNDWNVYGYGGADIFEAGEGDGIVNIRDWVDGVDRVRLVDGITFEDLSITASGSRVHAYADGSNGSSDFDLKIRFLGTSLADISADDFFAGSGEGGAGNEEPVVNPRFVISNYDEHWFSTTTELDTNPVSNSEDWWYDGGLGDDRITAGGGDDYIIAGGDNDWGIRGGAGADIFEAGFNDQSIMIWDWQDGVDKIRLVDGLEISESTFYRYGDYDAARFDMDNDGVVETRIYFRNTAAGTMDASDFIF